MDFKSPPISSNGPRRRVDIPSTLFLTIRSAYTTPHAIEIAHAIVERKLRKLVTPTNSVLYLNGRPSQEKEPTHSREAPCARAAVPFCPEKLEEGILLDA